MTNKIVSSESTALTLEVIAGQTDMWYQQTTPEKASATEGDSKNTKKKPQKQPNGRQHIGKATQVTGRGD